MVPRATFVSLGASRKVCDTQPMLRRRNKSKSTAAPDVAPEGDGETMPTAEMPAGAALAPVEAPTPTPDRPADTLSA